jgi:uncharacterized protein
MSTSTVILDASVLDYLHRLELLGLLRRLYPEHRFLVPLTVCAELDAGRAYGIDLPDPRSIPWMEVCDAAPAPELAPFDLDPGELAVLSMAVTSPKPVIVLLDDRDARKAAFELGIDHPGVLAILLAARQRGLLVRVRPCLKRLQALGFRISAQLYAAVLAEAGEPDED